MVIGPGRGKVAAFVILGDGEFIPEQFNNPRVVVYRKGWMTFGELKEIKPYGEMAKSIDLRPADHPEKAGCQHPREGDPLHQHPDGSFWYFDAAFQLENGPFPTYDLALSSLSDYCKDFQAKASAGLATNVEGDLVLLERFGLTKKEEGSTIPYDKNALKKVEDNFGPDDLG